MTCLVLRSSFPLTEGAGGGDGGKETAVVYDAGYYFFSPAGCLGERGYICKADMKSVGEFGVWKITKPVSLSVLNLYLLEYVRIALRLIIGLLGFVTVVLEQTSYPPTPFSKLLPLDSVVQTLLPTTPKHPHHLPYSPQSPPTPLNNSSPKSIPPPKHPPPTPPILLNTPSPPPRVPARARVSLLRDCQRRVVRSSLPALGRPSYQQLRRSKDETRSIQRRIPRPYFTGRP